MRRVGFERPSDEEARIAEELLEGEIVVDEPNILREGDWDIYPIEDDDTSLMEIAQKCLAGNYESHPTRLIKGLCNEFTINRLLENGEPKWVSVEDINEVFQVETRETTRGALAWYLSQPPGSGHYHGQWFEKRGKFVRTRATGNVALSRSSLPRFKTRAYRLTQSALETLKWLIKQGFKSESY